MGHNRPPKEIAPREKTCFCHTCQRDFHPLGIMRHVAMHRDRKQNCRVTYTQGDTYNWNFRNQPCVIGLDLASKHDIVAICRKHSDFMKYDAAAVIKT